MQSIWNVFNGLSVRIEALACENQELRKRNDTLNLQLLNIFDKQESTFSDKNQENERLRKLYEELQTQNMGVNALLEQERSSKENIMKLMETQRRKNEEETSLLREQAVSGMGYQEPHVILSQCVFLIYNLVIFE